MKRTAENDVGEMRRVLSSFLQFMEEEATESIILAATNNPQLLDLALFRRFDLIIEYGLPDSQGVKLLIQNRLANASFLGLHGAKYVRMRLTSVLQKSVLRPKMRQKMLFSLDVRKSLLKIYPVLWLGVVQL